MKKKVLHFEFPLKDFFIKVFKDNVYLVGGTVRDFLLYDKIDNHRDIDLLVVEHTYEQIEKKLKKHGKTNTVGKAFAIVKFTLGDLGFDIAVPRKDTKINPLSHSHRDFSVDQGPHITLEEDLKRRDFTCNSIALRLSDGELIDPCGGVQAIKEKRISMTSRESFADDPLRVLRAARYASVHHLKIDEEIYPIAKDIEMAELSSERICDELFRLLIESEAPTDGLNEYFKLSVLEKLFPELYTLTLTIQDSSFHPEQDDHGHHTVWAHTLIAVDIARKLAEMYFLNEQRLLTLLLATLIHDVGKSVTTKWEFKHRRMTITSLLHDSQGLKIAEKWLQHLRIETLTGYPLRKVILNLVKNHHRIYELFRNKETINFKSIAKTVKDMDGEDFLLGLLDFADRQSRESNPLNFKDFDEIARWFLRKKEEYQITKETIKPLVRGRDLITLGLEPGIKMGELLKQLYELQLDGAFKTRDEGLHILRSLLEKKT